MHAQLVYYQLLNVLMHFALKPGMQCKYFICIFEISGRNLVGKRVVIIGKIPGSRKLLL